MASPCEPPPGGTGRGYFDLRSRQQDEAASLVSPPYPRNKLCCNPSKGPPSGAVTPVTPPPGKRPPARLGRASRGRVCAPDAVPGARGVRPADCRKGFHSPPRCAKMGRSIALSYRKEGTMRTMIAVVIVGS